MKIRVDNFEGPLDLLLQLIEKEELDITQVSLLKVAEQYIEFLERIENKHPEMLADFLVIASRLLYIKSRVLLPELEMENDEDSIGLENQLRMYKKYYDASQVVEGMLKKDNYAFARPEYLVKSDKFSPPKSLNQNKLSKILFEVIAQIEIVVQLPKKTIEKIISIKKKIQSIQSLLRKKGVFNFGDIIDEKGNKKEMIVSFLGLLELSKQRELVLDQEQLFGDISVRRLGK